MHTEYLQNIRYKLQKRIRRLKSSGWEQYVPVLRQFWRFFNQQKALLAVAEELDTSFPSTSADVDQIFAGTLLDADDEHEWAALSLGVLRRFAQHADPREFLPKLVPPQSSAHYNDYLEAFNTRYLIPFYEYVDERLDDPRFILGQLIRFKHLCEWFWRGKLFDAWERSSGRGEKMLALRLYEFLFTEGIDVAIEPWSVSGEVDMVGSQEGADRLIADAKVFNPEKARGAKYIIQGFRQVYQYACDYNEPFGYLAIFNTSNKQLRFAVAGAADPLPHVMMNHKTIFFLVIDLYPHETSASKRPQPEIIEITDAEITGAPPVAESAAGNSAE